LSRSSASRRIHRGELQDRLADRFSRVEAPALLFREEAERHSAAAPEASHFAPALLFGNHRHTQAREWPNITDHQAGRGRDKDHLLLAREARDHLAHAGIKRAREAVNPIKQLAFLRNRSCDRRARNAVEVVRRAQRSNRNNPGLAVSVSDRPCLFRRLLQVCDGDLIGVGVARALLGLSSDTRSLADMARRFLERRLLEQQLLRDPVLEVEVAVIHTAFESASEELIQLGGVEAKAVGKKLLWPCKCFWHFPS